MTLDDQTACKRSAVDTAQKKIGAGRQWISGKTATLWLVAGAYGLGGGGMAAWLAFVFLGPWIRRPPAAGIAANLAVDALLCLIFFIQHSFMVRRGFRLWLTRFVRVELHGTLYASASGACLLALVLLWRPAGPPLWSPPDGFRWAMAGIALLAAAGAWWGTRALGEFDALGIRPAMVILGRGRPDTPGRFMVHGPYRWVRHPLYLASLVIIWSGPVFSLDRLLHNLLWSIWIVIGAIFEERDLAACFGDAYRAYRRSVPMLLPKSLRPLVPDGYHPEQDRR